MVIRCSFEHRSSDGKCTRESCTQPAPGLAVPGLGPADTKEKLPDQDRRRSDHTSCLRTASRTNSSTLLRSQKPTPERHSRMRCKQLHTAENLDRNLSHSPRSLTRKNHCYIDKCNCRRIPAGYRTRCTAAPSMPVDTPDIQGRSSLHTCHIDHRKTRCYKRTCTEETRTRRRFRCNNQGCRRHCKPETTGQNWLHIFHSSTRCTPNHMRDMRNSR